MGNSSQKETNAKYWINVLIMLFFYFGFGFLPPFGGIPQVGMQVLGVFIGMIWGWMFIDMLWPSLLGMVALGLTSYSSGVLSVFQAGASNKNVILIFLFFIFSQYLEHSGLSRTIAMKLMVMKWVQGKPWRLVFMMLFATYVLGVFINTYAVIFLVWTIIYDMCELVGYGKGSTMAGFLLVGVVQIAAISGTIMPYQVFPALCLTQLNSATGLTVASGPFILFNLVISFLGMFAYYLVGRYMLKIDVSKLEGITPEQLLKDEPIDYNAEQKIATVIMIVFLLLILVPGFLPADNPIKAAYKVIGDQGILAIMLVIAAALQLKKGKPLAKISDLIVKGVNWSLMFLLMATFTIGDAINSDSVGIISLLSSILIPFFSGMSPIVFLVVAFILLAIITQFAHNIVLATVFVPLLSSLAIAAGFGESIAILVTLGLAIVLLQALMTPAASNRGALTFGNDWIGRHGALVYGTAAVVTADLVVIIVGIPLGLLMF